MKSKLFDLKKMYATYAFFMMGYILSASYYTVEYQLLHYVMLLFFGCGYLTGLYKILSQKYNYIKIVKIAFLLFLGMMCFFSNFAGGLMQASMVMSFFFIVICADKFVFSEIVLIDVKMRLAAIIFLFFSSMLGFVQDYCMFRPEGGIRHSFGFTHPNVFGTNVFLTVLYLTIYRRNRLSIWDCLYQGVALGIVFCFADSRSNVIGLTFILFYTLLNIIFKKFSKYYKRSFSKTIAYFLCTFILMIVFVIVYASVNFNQASLFYFILNYLLSARLVLANNAMKMYDITIWGQNIQSYAQSQVEGMGVSAGLVGIDISYINILLRYGIVVFTIYIMIIEYIVKKYSIKDSAIALAVVLICIVSMVEHQYFPVWANIFVLLFADWIYGDNSIKI